MFIKSFLVALILTLSLPTYAQDKAAEKAPKNSPAKNTEAVQAKEKKKVAQEAPSPSCRPDKKVSTTVISRQMAETWCQKLQQCSPNSEMGPKECHKVLKKSFLEGFKNVAPGQKIEVFEAGLCQCSESIAKDTCDALRTAQTLPGCGFIRLLNRG